MEAQATKMWAKDGPMLGQRVPKGRGQKQVPNSFPQVWVSRPRDRDKRQGQGVGTGSNSVGKIPALRSNQDLWSKLNPHKIGEEIPATTGLK